MNHPTGAALEALLSERLAAEPSFNVADARALAEANDAAILDAYAGACALPPAAPPIEPERVEPPEEERRAYPEHFHGDQDEEPCR